MTVRDNLPAFGPAVPRTAVEMKKRGWLAEKIDAVIYGNPQRFMRQTSKFKL